MPIVKDKWKETVTEALTKAGLLSPRFSGKFVVAVADGGIRFIEICQTVK